MIYIGCDFKNVFLQYIFYSFSPSAQMRVIVVSGVRLVQYILNI